MVHKLSINALQFFSSSLNYWIFFFFWRSGILVVLKRIEEILWEEDGQLFILTKTPKGPYDRTDTSDRRRSLKLFFRSKKYKTNRFEYVTSLVERVVTMNYIRESRGTGTVVVSVSLKIWGNLKREKILKTLQVCDPL